MKQNRSKLYLITPELVNPKQFARILAPTLDAGDVACVQLRQKAMSRDQLLKAIDVLRPVVKERNITFLLNDDPELAKISGCDGVHIGKDDMPYEQTRRVVGNNLIVGVTCLDSFDDALSAAESGADYVAFGAFFPTKTKISEGNPSEDLLTKWNNSKACPAVAIGGINISNCAKLVQSGVDYIAVISGVWDHPMGPAYSVKKFNQIINGLNI